MFRFAMTLVAVAAAYVSRVRAPFSGSESVAAVSPRRAVFASAARRRKSDTCENPARWLAAKPRHKRYFPDVTTARAYEVAAHMRTPSPPSHAIRPPRTRTYRLRGVRRAALSPRHVRPPFDPLPPKKRHQPIWRTPLPASRLFMRGTTPDAQTAMSPCYAIDGRQDSRRQRVSLAGGVA